MFGSTRYITECAEINGHKFPKLHLKSSDVIRKKNSLSPCSLTAWYDDDGNGFVVACREWISREIKMQSHKFMLLHKSENFSHIMLYVHRRQTRSKCFIYRRPNISHSSHGDLCLLRSYCNVIKQWARSFNFIYFENSLQLLGEAKRFAEDHVEIRIKNENNERISA